MALKVGQSAQVERAFTAADIADYAILGRQVPVQGEVPEPLVGALFSYLLGVKLPGTGTNYLKQETEFKATVHVNQTLTARVEITRLRPEKHLVDLRTTCRNDAGDTICDGRALVYVKDVPE